MNIEVKADGVIEKSIDWAGKKLTLQTGKVAKQADGAILAQMGDTVVLVSVVFDKKPSENKGFFPLSVTYKEMFSSAGKIPGGFIKRETKPSDKEVLISRLIDRSVRPMFSKGFEHEVQVIANVISYDPNNDPAVLSMVGVSAALAISSIPLKGIVGAARIGFINEAVVINPTAEELKRSKLDLVISGEKNRVGMVESSALEFAEESIISCIKQGLSAFDPVIDMINDLKAQVGVEEFSYSQNVVNDSENLSNELSKQYGQDIESNLTFTTKRERNKAFSLLESKIIAEMKASGSDIKDEIVTDALNKAQEKSMRSNILNGNGRIAGRGSEQIREISSEVGLLPRTHGSALFTRGETQALAVITLGTTEDEQVVDGISGDARENFFLHYSFPPYSVGECGALRAPGRREIGHGCLASKALKSIMPKQSVFPYTVRINSEVTESNGSSSQATICSSVLSLMDAGVPIKSMVAGIAMGLIKEGGDYVILSDISGEEDQIGDMDFKVAGTEKGITALQMDSKINIELNILLEALVQAKAGRLSILQKMSAVLSKARDKVSEYAPIIDTLKINRDGIKDLIGPGGRVIREICETTGAKINVGDDGDVNIAAPNQSKMNAALELIKKAIGMDIEIGGKFDGKVVKIISAGIFVSFGDSTKDGFVHISEIAEGHVDNIYDHIEEGQKVKVVVLNIESGKIRLSIKRFDESSETIKAEARNNSDRSSSVKPRYDRGYRGGDRSNNRRDGNSGGGSFNRRDGSSGGSFNRRDGSSGGGNFNRRDSSGGGSFNRKEDVGNFSRRDRDQDASKRKPSGNSRVTSERKYFN